MKKVVLGLAGVLGAAQPGMVAAQQPLVAVERPLTASAGSVLPSNSEVWVSMNQELSSKRIRHGEKFDVTVARDVMVGNYIVIPRGARGHGQISYRTGKGAFGKSAKMEFDIVDVEAGGSFVPLSGHYRIEGPGNTGAAVGAVVAVGVFGAFVTGRSAVAAQGTEWKAFTREPLPIQLAAAAMTLPAAAPAAGAAVATGRPALTPYELGRLQGEQAIASAQAQTASR